MHTIPVIAPPGIELSSVLRKAAHCTLFDPDFRELILCIVIRDGRDPELNEKLEQSVTKGNFRDITNLLKQKWEMLRDSLYPLCDERISETDRVNAAQNLALIALVVQTLYERCCQADEANSPPIHDTS